ncbi:MAG TPA: tetratricopeptide repeat protein [Pyrinomonadaceae bacterium]|jgi:tetratricopeptide (TPR) repeat protein
MKKVASLITFCVLLSLAGASVYAQSTAEEFHQRSFTRLTERDLDGAIADADRAIALKPDYVDAYTHRSNLQMMKGRVDAALADISKAIELNPELVQAYVQRGRMRMMKNNMDGALEDFNNAIGRGHRSDEIYAARAQIKMMTNDVEGAIQDFSAAISLNPKRVGSYNGRATARMYAKDEDGALADYGYVIEQYEQQAQERKKEGKPATKAPVFDMRSPTIVTPETTAQGQASGQKKEKISTHEVVVKHINPGSLESVEQIENTMNVAAAYGGRARILGKRGQWDAALKDYNKAIEINPDEFVMYFNRGYGWREQGDLKAALADFNKAIEIQPQSAFNYLERGLTLLLMGRDADAQKDFDQLLKLNPSMQTALEKRRAEAIKQRSEKTQ